MLNPRRHPPVLRPTLRNGRPNMNYRLGTDNPRAPTSISDDLVVLHLQYSTQWDSFAHVGQLFDADGDGIAEPVYYNGYRAGQHIVGPTDATDAGAPARGDERRPRGAGARHREHGRDAACRAAAVMIDLHAAFRRRAHAWSATTS